MNQLPEDGAKDLLHTAEKLKRMNFSEEDEPSKENPINAGDQTRIEEREQRLATEQDTDRLMTERKSVEQGKTAD